jgi:hypothetical protein
MTLARKGSRRLAPNEHEYRWAVSGNGGYIILVVESGTSHGQRSEAFFEYHNTVLVNKAKMNNVGSPLTL